MYVKDQVSNKDNWGSISLWTLRDTVWICLRISLMRCGSLSHLGFDSITLWWGWLQPYDLFSPPWLCLYVAQQAPLTARENPSAEKKDMHRPLSQPSDGCELSITSDKPEWANEIWSRPQWGQLLIWSEAPSQILEWK